VGYFSASSGAIQPLRFAKDGEQITLDGVRSDVLVSESNAHLATAIAGLGIVHSLAFMARPAIARGELVSFLAEWTPEPPLDVFVAHPPSRRFSTKVRVFVDWVKAVFASLCP
jgi:DNA-binding transcriptional LysR family regulator